MKMGKKSANIALSLLLSLFMSRPMVCQGKKEDKPIREYVNIVNVELVLRVMKNGQTVGGFQKEDFKLFENGKERAINGFFEIRRRMAPIDGKNEETEKTVLRPGRLFLLFFWGGGSENGVRAKLDYFFEKIYQAGDRIILASDEQIVEIGVSGQTERVKEEFLKGCGVSLRRNDQELRSSVRDLNHALAETTSILEAINSRFPASISSAMASLKNLIQQYFISMREWDYRNNRFSLDSLKRMAGDMATIKADKWALVFYEREDRPFFDVDRVKDLLLTASRGQIAQEIEESAVALKKIAFQAKGQSAIYSQIRTLRDCFAQSGVVFHLLQMSPMNQKEILLDIISNNSSLNMEPVFSNWDAVFQAISKVSGGQIVDLDKGIGELGKLAQQENISYTLTYVPSEKRVKERKIELRIVNTERKHLQKHLLYGRKLEMESLPQLKVAGISSDERQMKIILESFYPVNTRDGPRGHFTVSLAAEKAGSPAKVLYQEDMESGGEIEIPVQMKEPGDWTLWFRIVDLMSGQSVLEKRKIIVIGEESAMASTATQTTQEKDELGTLLLKAAAYSDRLKKTALKFTCVEEIVEQVRRRKDEDPHQRFGRTTWLYDYQIVVDRGKLTENRLLLRKDRKKISPPLPAKLESFYESQYSFFMPATMLASDRQGDYLYTIFGREKIRKRKMVKVRAKPKKASQELPGGELWIDAEDGSVWRIVLDAQTIPGLRNRFVSAQERGIQLVMTDIHEYFERHGGIQFPTSTSINENHTYTRIYKHVVEGSGGLEDPGMISTRRLSPVQMDVLRVNYRYEKYRFFAVDAQEVIEGPEE